MEDKWKAEKKNLSNIDYYYVNEKYRLEIYKSTKKKINNNLSLTAYIPSPNAKNEQLVIYNKKTNQVIFLLRDRIGFKDSLDSETYSICDNTIKVPYRKNKFIFDCDLEGIDPNSNIIGLKIIPIFVGDDRMKREINIMEKVNKLILNKNCPNFQLLYGYNIVKNIDYRILDNQRLLHRLKLFYKNQYEIDMYFVYNEFSFSNLDYFIKKTKKINTEIIHSLVFQVLSGLAALNKHYSIVHFDLHIGNILFNSVKDIDYIKYKIRNKVYYVPTYGTLFTIIDYSRSAILSSDMDEEIKKKFVFHCRKQFGIEFEYGIEQILKNLEKNNQYYKYMYSYDTFRFIKNLLIVTRNIDYNNKLLYKILNIAKNDLTKNILKGDFKFAGAPINILTKYFKKYQRKQKNKKYSDLYTI